MSRKPRALKKKPVPPHKAAERVIEAASQPVSTQAPHQTLDIRSKGTSERAPEKGVFEQTMKDYYAQSDVEAQGGVPKDPPDQNPMPLQHVERKPKHPPRHNM